MNYATAVVNYTSGGVFYDHNVHSAGHRSNPLTFFATLVDSGLVLKGTIKACKGQILLFGVSLMRR